VIEACAAIGLLAASAANSAPAESTAESAATDQLVEITVTAQRHVENAQKVPISVVPITPDAILNAGALNTDQLAQLVPGMQMGHEINGATTFIRGIGPSSNGTGEESSVAVYLDDIYIPDGNASIFQLSAISGIDVLKGPQGTLFGRNATGGVVQVHTKDPTFDPGADLEGGYGNYGTFTGSIYATGKIIDNVASNLAVWISDQQHGGAMMSRPGRTRSPRRIGVSATSGCGPRLPGREFYFREISPTRAAK
jgi:iron complex outermembrane receptor protein